jgi:hypothetical protein
MIPNINILIYSSSYQHCTAHYSFSSHCIVLRSPYGDFFSESGNSFLFIIVYQQGMKHTYRTEGSSSTTITLPPLLFKTRTTKQILSSISFNIILLSACNGYRHRRLILTQPTPFSVSHCSHHLHAMIRDNHALSMCLRVRYP